MRALAAGLATCSLLAGAALGGEAAESEDSAQGPLTPLAVTADLGRLGAEARAAGVPILLMYSSEGCDFCQRLESEVLGPMRLGGAEPGQVLLRKVMLEDYETLRDFQGERLSAGDFAHRNGVQVVPTVSLLDANGKELAPRIVGYTSPDFYAAYLDQAISLSRALLAQHRSGAE